MIIDIPRFKCFVKKEFLTGGEGTGVLEAYCFACTLIESRALLFTVHTIEGAVFSRLPLKALQWREELLFHIDPLEVLVDVWGAISSNGHAIKHQYLKDYLVRVALPDQTCEGSYMFTIDYFDGGFAEDPEQHKTSNFIALENGQICAAPNNMCLFLDKHFTRDNIETSYKRSSTYYHI